MWICNKSLIYYKRAYVLSKISTRALKIFHQCNWQNLRYLEVMVFVMNFNLDAWLINNFNLDVWHCNAQLILILLLYKFYYCKNFIILNLYMIFNKFVGRFFHIAMNFSLSVCCDCGSGCFIIIGVTIRIYWQIEWPPLCGTLNSSSFQEPHSYTQLLDIWTISKVAIRRVSIYQGLWKPQILWQIVCDSLKHTRCIFKDYPEWCGFCGLFKG